MSREGGAGGQDTREGRSVEPGRTLVLAKPPKPIAAMTDDERRAFARQLAALLVRGR